MKKEKYYKSQKGRASTVREDAIPYHAAQKSEMVIYQTKDHHTEVAVRFDGETFWLSLNQIAALFERDKSVISRHLRNIYQEGELKKRATVAKNATVQIEAGREVNRDIEYYNLDVILSVGYRVNSKRGTQFRQWATQRLKDYLAKGYAINQKRLLELQQAIQLISGGGSVETLQLQEAKGLLEIQCRLVKDSQGHFDFAQCPKMRSLSEVETNTSQVFSLN